MEGNPFASRLSPQNPTTIYLQTAAVHAKNMPLELRDAILSSPLNNKVVEFMNGSLETRALIRTSTAVDVVHGGEKCMFDLLMAMLYALALTTLASKCIARDGQHFGQPSNRSRRVCSVRERPLRAFPVTISRQMVFQSEGLRY